MSGGITRRGFGMGLAAMLAAGAAPYAATGGSSRGMTRCLAARLAATGSEEEPLLVVPREFRKYGFNPSTVIPDEWMQEGVGLVSFARNGYTQNSPPVDIIEPGVYRIVAANRGIWYGIGIVTALGIGSYRFSCTTDKVTRMASVTFYEGIAESGYSFNSFVYVEPKGNDVALPFSVPVAGKQVIGVLCNYSDGEIHDTIVRNCEVTKA